MWKSLLIAVLFLLTAGVAGWRLLSRTPGTPPGSERSQPIAGLQTQTTVATRPPNVLLVSLDNTRPDHLGCYGYDKPTSPNLDHFAAQAVRFSTTRCQAPITLPSHMSLLTSMTPTDNGVMAYNSVLPESFPTLAQLLQGGGYHTAGLVNNGYMQAHWGFARGFDLWREFEVYTEQSNCQSITAAALDWMAARPSDPWFLFLHYYDAHLPYAAPEEFRKKFGATIPLEQIRGVVQDHQGPERPLPAETVQQLKASYDAALAWQDRELGKLLAAVPDDTLVVLFSDHGEAFKEHGWTFHGASLYEEETRVMLIVRPPAKQAAGATRAAPAAVMDEPVALLDVTPTILGYCGISPARFTSGFDLRPLIAGGTLPPRPIPAETREQQTGRMLKSLTMAEQAAASLPTTKPPMIEQKAIYSIFDGRREVYRLPDELNNLAGAPPPEGELLLGMIRRWVTAAGEEDYWVVHARGDHEFEVSLTLPRGEFTYMVPTGEDGKRPDRLRVAGDARSAIWRVRAGARGAALVFWVTDPAAPVKFDATVDGTKPAQVMVGAAQTPVSGLPVDLDMSDNALSPWIEHPFEPGADGIFVLRYRNPDAPTRPKRVERLDQATQERLRSMGYMQ